MPVSVPRASGSNLVDGALALSAQAYVLAVRVLGSSEGADDVVQTAYLDVLRRLRGGFVPNDLKAWFLVAVMNVAREHLRAESHRRGREEAMRKRVGAAAGAAVDGELVGDLAARLAELDEKYRLPISLCYEQGLTQREAAAILEIPERTLSQRIGDGLEALRNALARAGYAVAPAAVLAGLAHTAPTMPAGLAVAIGKMASMGAASGEGVSTTGGAAGLAASKGGLIVKIGLGVAAVGLAAGAALWASGGRSQESAAGAPASGGADVPHGKALYAEHFAFMRMHVPEGTGGPAKQAGRGGWGFCAIDKKGNFFLGDPQNCQVHWVDTEGVDRIIAGDGKKGYRDGIGDRARFDFGCGSYNDLALDCDDDGNVYIADGMNDRLRKISRQEDGSWLVTTVSGGGDKRVKKGEWIAASDLKYGCATRFAVTDDGTAAYYCTYGGLYKVLLKENKATVLNSPEDLKAAGFSAPYSWHVGGAHVTKDGVYYWMPGGSSILRFDEKTGKAERFAGCGQGTRKDATDRLTAGFHTVHAIYSPNASVIYTGGGDEFECRRIYQNKVMHLMQDGSWQQTDSRNGAWQYGSLMALDPEGRLYTIPAPYSWPGWIVRMTFEKE